MAGNSFKITLKNLRQAKDEIRQVDQNALNGIKKITAKSALKIEGLAKNKAPADTGLLRSSIKTRIKGGGLKADVFSDKDYAIYVERGTRPHWPPIDAIRQWAERRGIPPFLVARAIHRKGTDPQPFLKPAYEEERPRYISDIKKFLKNLD